MTHTKSASRISFTMFKILPDLKMLSYSVFGNADHQNDQHDHAHNSHDFSSPFHIRRSPKMTSGNTE